MAVFVRALDSEDKAAVLYQSLRKVCNGERAKGVWYAQPTAFSRIVGAPLAYWVPSEILDVLASGPPIEGRLVSVRKGLSTADNERFLRLSWEVAGCEMWGDLPTAMQAKWAPLVKGGEYWPWYDDIHLCINWAGGGEEVSAFQGSVVRSIDRYFESGGTYPYRTTSAFSVRVLPSGSIFSDGGPAVLPTPGGEDSLWEILFYLNTRVARYLLEIFLGEGDSVASVGAARNYLVSLVGAVPAPKFDGGVPPDYKVWLLAAMGRWRSKEESRSFLRPALHTKGSLISAAQKSYSEHLKQCVASMDVAMEGETRLFSGFALSSASVSAIEESMGMNPVGYPMSRVEDEVLHSLFELSIDDLVDEVAERIGRSRQITKKAFYADRRLELVCHLLQCHPASVAQKVQGLGLLPKGMAEDSAGSAVGYLLGVAFGRFDVRWSTLDLPAPDTPDPFDPLPVCSPGMLQGPDGLPARRDSIASEDWLRARPDAIRLPEPGSLSKPSITVDEYPVRVAWDGILVDDPGLPSQQPADRDIVRRVHQVIELLWDEKAGDIEEEICQILSIASLREYFRKPSGFFADHLSRYSKSRRKAPIYWPLSTESGSYTLWIYYHRLDEDLLYRAVNEHVSPKISQVEQRLAQLEGQRQQASGREAAQLSKEIDELTQLVGELSDLREELLRVAKLPYRPNLNDGVQITAAPLWKLFRLKKWRDVLEKTWKELEEGKYDWAHLALTLWPERVEEKCETDKSLAIAHDLKQYWEELSA